MSIKSDIDDAEWEVEMANLRDRERAEAKAKAARKAEVERARIARSSETSDLRAEQLRWRMRLVGRS